MMDCTVGKCFVERKWTGKYWVEINGNDYHEFGSYAAVTDFVKEIRKQSETKWKDVHINKVYGKEKTA